MALTIHTKDLVKKYGSRTVVNHVSFDVSQGEIVGLLGPNGAGKTTSFYQVVGLIKPDEGQVFLGDENITQLPMYKRAKMGIGYLPQEASVFRKLSVEDNISAVLEMIGLSKQQQKEKLETLLDEFRLHHVRKSNGDVLSGGERRRTEIARALAVDPKFILLDEPFAGIDPIAVEDIQTIVATLKHKNIGILITDHNVTETLSICDRAYLLIEGKIFKHGTAEELADDEQVRKLYLGRNFELKRKDYLYEEQGLRISKKRESKEVKPELLAYSIQSLINLIDKALSLPITVSNIQKHEETGLKDISSFLKELKKTAQVFGISFGSKMFNETIASLPSINLQDYRPRGLFKTLLGNFGYAGQSIAFQPAVTRLQEDLGTLKSSLNRLLILVKNPSFEEAMQD
jgi:lipopolysaccharide export system ATP-binding protein